MNVQRFLKVCEDIEQTVSKIYRHWQEVFVDTPALSAMWARMADDELDHVRQIQLAKRVAYENVFEGNNVSIDDLEKALAKARRLLVDVKEKEISAEKALLAAIKMEELFSQAHLMNATNVVDESMATMFKSLAREDEMHVATLRNYYDSVYGSE